ncbi:uncharacterized protein METZ01_LOCUS300136, partial [marine metagenome]
SRGYFPVRKLRNRCLGINIGRYCSAVPTWKRFNSIGHSNDANISKTQGSI